MGFLTFAVIAVALVSGLTILFSHRSVEKARDDQGGPRSGSCCRHATGQVPFASDQFHLVAEQVLLRAGARLLEPRRAGRVSAYTPMSLRSYGSILTIWYAPIPGGTGFTVESRPRQPFLLYDYGRNQKMVDQVTRGLVTVGPFEAVPAQWAPDPYRRHQHRYWDGVAWTEHVDDDGQRGVDPPVSAG